MIKKSRREFLRDASFGCLSLSVAPYLIGVNKEVSAEVKGNFNKHNFLNPNLISWNDIGPLQVSNEFGVMVPEGMECKLIAKSGRKISNTYKWHGSPDGASIFSTDDGGWIYVSNSELWDNKGGVGAIKFNRSGDIQDSYPILLNTSRNCSGGVTPWGTWLSCEEHDRGIVWETSPIKNNPNYPKKREMLGVFKHEGAAVDPISNYIYMTNDDMRGLFFRFISNKKPGSEEFYLEGELQAAEVNYDGTLNWIKVPDPYAKKDTISDQLPEATVFQRGEGIAYYDRKIFFTTTYDHRVWVYEPEINKLSIFYDGLGNIDNSNPINWLKRWKKDKEGYTLKNPDQITLNADGYPLVAEDGGNMELCFLDKSGFAKPLIRLDGHWLSEITGPAFSPDGSRLYFSSQRGITGSRSSGGMTFEIKKII